MVLASGSRLGPYVITAPLGAGGMGEVYKAIDSRLDRTVAIKVIASDVASDPARVDRFEREAKTISSLNHPNICTIFDVGHQDGTRFLVMEYLEGESLQERLQREPLSIEQSLQIAIEIADALTAAHRAGIVHRDLKPGNMMLTRRGAKLLDFGLAKAAPRTPIANASTTSDLTTPGSIIGTFHYMAPEQVEGQATDQRTDIFAFGAVLYEMLAGKKAFDGASSTSVMAAILTQDPPALVALQPLTPRALDRVVKKCLAKDPEARWQSARDLHDELKWIAGDSGAASPVHIDRVSSPINRIALIAIGACAGAAIVAAAWWQWDRTRLRDTSVSHLQVSVAPADYLSSNLPEERRFRPTRPSRPAIAWSPDGRRFAFTAVRGNTQQIYLRALDQPDATALAGTESGDTPFFSPDGQWIGFWKDDALRKIPIGGGPAVTICATPAINGASWSANDTIAFARWNEALWQVPADAGMPQPLTTLDATNGETGHQLPHWLPGGRAIVYTVIGGGTTRIGVRSIAGGEQKILVEHGAADARYTPSGHLLYAQSGVLMAAPFDIGSLQLTGGAVGMIDGVMQAVNAPSNPINRGAAQFDVSNTGTLLYLAGGTYPTPARVVVWVDRGGTVETMPLTPGPFLNPRLSPDGNRIALSSLVGGAARDMLIYEISRKMTTRFLVPDVQRPLRPIWTPDGARLTFTAVGGIFWKAADGSGRAEKLVDTADSTMPESWSRDGKTLAFFQGPTLGGGDVWTVAINAGKPEAAKPFVNHTGVREQWPDISPDGKWIAFTSDESGAHEVYVQPFPGPGARQQVSANGGSQPLWAHNGRELFFTVADPNASADFSKVMVVDVTTTPTFRAGVPRPLKAAVRITVPARGYDLSLDDKRFLTVRDIEDTKQPPVNQIIVIQNWLDEVKRRTAR